jgi:hypothetical protein
MIKWILALVAGGLLGYGYWFYIGCTSGSCAITSSAINSTAYGALMGVLLLNAFSKPKVRSDS